MVTQMVAGVIAATCLIVLVQSAPSNAPRAGNVSVQMLDFSFTGNCDPFGISKCDLLFKVDFSWNGKSRKVNYGTYSSGSSAHVDFGKEEPQNLDGPHGAGSKIVVNVEALDDDYISDDVLGRFRFEYTVPATSEPQSVLTLRDGKATMTIILESHF